MSETTSVSDWKTKNKPTPLDLPSGNKCLARPVGLDVFMKQGMVPNSLMEIVTKSLVAGQVMNASDVNQEEIMAEALQDPEKLRGIFDLADAATIYCVIEPPVSPLPDDPETPRDEGKLYVDEIDLDDKLFIFNFAVGGSRDLEAFRVATGGGVGSVSLSNLVPQPPKQLDGD